MNGIAASSASPSDPVVSSDIIKDPRASVVDLGMTQVVDGDLLKVMSWYDNEWGYSNQLVREALRIGQNDGSSERSEGTMIDVRQRLQLPSGASATYYSLPLLETRGIGNISRLPVSVRIVLESVLRNVDGQRIRDEDVEALARWQPERARTAEVPFVVGRVLLQDFTGVPLLVDLAAMRSAIARRGLEVERVQPSVPVDLVIDHSVQVDYFGRAMRSASTWRWSSAATASAIASSSGARRPSRACGSFRPASASATR